MGANLCSFKQPASTDHNDHQKDQPKMPKGDNRTGPKSSAVMGLIRRPGWLDQITPHQTAEKKRSKARRVTTLEDWLIDSPATTTNGELYAFKHSSRKVHPSSSSFSSSCWKHRVTSNRTSSTELLASKAIDSITLEPVAKSGYGYSTSYKNSVGGKVVELERSASSLLSRNKGGKLVKKVSFKEEPNIVFIYSSPEEAS